MMYLMRLWSFNMFSKPEKWEGWMLIKMAIIWGISISKTTCSTTPTIIWRCEWNTATRRYHDISKPQSSCSKRFATRRYHDISMPQSSCSERFATRRYHMTFLCHKAAAARFATRRYHMTFLYHKVAAAKGKPQWGIMTFLCHKAAAARFATRRYRDISMSQSSCSKVCHNNPNYHKVTMM